MKREKGLQILEGKRTKMRKGVTNLNQRPTKRKNKLENDQAPSLSQVFQSPTLNQFAQKKTGKAKHIKVGGKLPKGNPIVL